MTPDDQPWLPAGHPTGSVTLDEAIEMASEDRAILEDRIRTAVTDLKLHGRAVLPSGAVLHLDAEDPDGPVITAPPAMPPDANLDEIGRQRLAEWHRRANQADRDDRQAQLLRQHAEAEQLRAARRSVQFNVQLCADEHARMLWRDRTGRGATIRFVDNITPSGRRRRAEIAAHKEQKAKARAARLARAERAAAAAAKPVQP